MFQPSNFILSGISPFISFNVDILPQIHPIRGGGMETRVLVANPNDEAVTVDLTLMTGEGEVMPEGLRNQTVPANSRRSFPIHDFVTTWDVSTRVEASGEVIAERSMYGPDRSWAHDSIGCGP